VAVACEGVEDEETREHNRVAVFDDRDGVQSGRICPELKSHGSRSKDVRREYWLRTLYGLLEPMLAPAYIAFAGVKNGDRVLDVGSSTGSLAAAIEASMPASEVVGIDPSEGFIAYAQKNAKSNRLHFEIGDAQVRTEPGTSDRNDCPSAVSVNRASDPNATSPRSLAARMSRRVAPALEPISEASSAVRAPPAS
jgi:SAM-dependent methyltransferase